MEIENPILYQILLIVWRIFLYIKFFECQAIHPGGFIRELSPISVKPSDVSCIIFIRSEILGVSKKRSCGRDSTSVVFEATVEELPRYRQKALQEHLNHSCLIEKSQWTRIIIIW